MATSSVARITAIALSIIWVLVSLANAQSVQPTNDTLPDSERLSETQLKLMGTALTGPESFNIAPLTDHAGLGQSAASVSQITFSGRIMDIYSGNMNNVTTMDIALISCDDPGTGFISPSDVVKTVGNIQPKAIILYSLVAPACSLNGSYTYATIFTMTSAADAKSVTSLAGMGLNPTVTQYQSALIGSNSTSTSGGSSADSTNNNGGPAPTTAVAMSILYSITGIITLLFLIIIATGAVRAHRHPERYGPRTGHLGRPRQSRAKGLARAMLETLPIVKFGDPEPVKPGTRDVELEDGNTSVHQSPDIAAAAAESTPANNPTQAKAVPVAEAVESGMNPNTQAESIRSGEEPAANKEGELGCSICTEDFTTGEDVRVLPCRHKYHPACIDPWLLNVSGTCPLCRHDLRPIPSHTTEPGSPGAQSTAGPEGDDLPPPLAAEAHTTEEADTPQRRRVSRFLDLHRLRTAPPDERIAALRRLREQSQREGEEVEEPSRRARLTGRLKDTFHIRTRRDGEA